MAGKKKTPPPIDKPLSRAYVRQFMGWSTAYPPGQSEPNSLRQMDNVGVDRNGALVVRPGLRYLTYIDPPGLDPVEHDEDGTPLGLEPVGAPELFYLGDGTRALLFAVREFNGTVGFRVVRLAGARQVVHRLTDEEIGFSVPQGESILNFSERTEHVEYLQINNRIMALSDYGEAARLFWVGGQKLAKKLDSISVPTWSNTQKLTLVHPEAEWINSRVLSTRYNIAMNPSFEIGLLNWTSSDGTVMAPVRDATANSGFVAEVTSAPTRTNLAVAPLHDVATTSITGWSAETTDTAAAVAGPYLQVTSNVKGEFLAGGPRIIDGVEGGAAYNIAVDFDADAGAQARMVLRSYSANGAELSRSTLDLGGSGGRYVSPEVYAADEATTLRLSIGGVCDGTPQSVRYRNILICPEGEQTDMFHGSTGADYFWTGDDNVSSSVYHPPRDIEVVGYPKGLSGYYTELAGEFGVSSPDASVSVTAGIRTYENTLDRDTYDELSSTVAVDSVDGWVRIGGGGTVDTLHVQVAPICTATAVPRGTRLRLDEVIVEVGKAAVGTYFDGSTPSTTSVVNHWDSDTEPHTSNSIELTVSPGLEPGDPETPTADTLVAAGGAASNDYKLAAFYTFENETGEGMPSKITEIRMQRPWSNWYWETANASGEPSGTATNDEYKCADQIIATLPEDIYEQAIAEGAIRWNLYAMTWSDQESVPVVAQLVGSRPIYTDTATEGVQPLPYNAAGWFPITPARSAAVYDMVLPTRDNRENNSVPPTHRNGIVAGDRMIMVGSPTQAATILWSSSQSGLYTNFTPSKGGGRKTLSSGNLNLPYSVVLWQNPQSVDTLTILCSDDNGFSTSYYMQPATVTGGNTGLATVMGFEETTSTPGTVAPFAAEVLNNALYRPLDRSLTKSTASNYNINHKTMTDKISNMWWLLESKRWIMSAQMDNRLYYLVHNPHGELLESGSKGNEIWVYDITSEAGHWSRFTVQGSALSSINVGGRTYIAVTKSDGIYYFDPMYYVDDYVDRYGAVDQQFIDWSFETNTQGANRAHDAWAHLQQVSAIFGNYQGSVQYGVRGKTLHGRDLNVSKVFTDNGRTPPVGQTWDVEDMLQIRRDMKEWYFYASSLPDTLGVGQIGVIQYRYTPTTVNVGYEFGSVESFEYGSDAGTDGSAYSRNGIPLPYIDYERP